MKKLIVILISLSTFLLNPLYADLIDNGDGTITDTDKGIMWTKNADLPGSRSITYNEAVNWVNNLDYAGYNDWRLPKGKDPRYDAYGSTLDGQYYSNCRESEFGNLFYNVLGGTAGLAIDLGWDNNFNIVPNTDPDLALFENILGATYQASIYWTDIKKDETHAWTFSFDGSYKAILSSSSSTYRLRAWAVRDISQNLTPPTKFMGLSGYNKAIPLAWKTPSGLSSSNMNSNIELIPFHKDLNEKGYSEFDMNNQNIPMMVEAEEKYIKKTSPVPQSNIMAPSGYHVYRSTSSNGNYSKIASNVSRTYYRDESVSNGQTYYYKIKAVYINGESDFYTTLSGKASSEYDISAGWASSTPTINGEIASGEWSSATTKTITYPGQTGTVKLYVMNNGSKLFFAVDDQRNPSLSNMDGVGIFFDLNKDREWPQSAGSNEGLIQLYYENGSMKARFQGLYGTWPDNLGGDNWQTANGISHKFSASSGHVQWEGSFDLNSSPIKTSPGNTIGFLVYSIDNGSLFTGAWPQQTAEKLPALVSGYGWAHGPFAYGDLKLKSSGGSAPTAPNNLTATAVSSSQINLSWSDNSNNETGFRIQRKEGSGGSWQTIKTTSASETSYQNTGLNANTTYYYRIYAYNSVGNSGDSNTAQATTLPATSNYNVSGNIKYFQNDHPVSNVNVALNGRTSTTNNSGTFTFYSVLQGNYTLTPVKENQLGMAISAYDASMILRNTVGLVSLNPYQMIAADVSGNGNVTAYDASYILRYTVGLIQQFPIAKAWGFVPENFSINSSNWNSAPDHISYNPLNSNQSDQNFKGVIYGDVSGNWTPMGLVKNVSGSAKVAFGEIEQNNAQQFSIPVKASISGDLLSAQINLRFAPEILKVTEICLGDKLQDFELAYNQNGGELVIATAGINAANLQSELFILKFEFLDQEFSAPTQIELINAKLNERRISIDLSNNNIFLNPALPSTHQLEQNYPNPFNPTTTIGFNLAKPTEVMLTVYDINGKEVKQLIHEIKPAGYHFVEWDAKDNQGLAAASGVYFYRVEVLGTEGKIQPFMDVKKMILMK